ncbi:Do family serine endopeptidase [Limibacter armeniacum]|uniref:Do family serine endopeptidase n=1 Tax=Limibacter armeniacum TaxID=466084 RepID=UPI002FE4FDA5
MSNTKLILTALLAAVMGGLVSVSAFKMLAPDQAVVSESNVAYPTNYTKPVEVPKNFIVPEGLNFITAAERVTPAVVHIKTISRAGSTQRYPDFFRDFFGEPYGGGGAPNGKSMASGSGVVISPDGYIATNNHVVENSESIEVVLEDKRSYEAELIGTDPTTDLALLKIKEKNLSYIPFGHSDNVKVGQWVLAVGNPFDLTSTVTAGIVSAKARNINILRRKSNLAIESFIQTDAAVNPGNSGGALVDLQGNLVGINTAIASNTGSFAGYSFAVPADLVKKVTDDLKEYGTVQRAVIGVQITDIDSDLQEKEGLDAIEGVYVAGIAPNGGADDAGIEKGDVILGVSDTPVNSVSELQEMIARKRPGEEVTVKIKRGNSIKDYNITLKNTNNTTAIVKAPRTMNEAVKALNAEVRSLTDEEKSQFGVSRGVIVTKIGSGKLGDSGMQPGFVITHVDKSPIASPEDLGAALKGKKGGVLIEGLYPADGEKGFYGIGF